MLVLGGKACFCPYIVLAPDPRADGHFFGLETKPGTFCPSTAITALAWSREEAQRKTKNAKLYHRNVVECVQALEEDTEMPLLRRNERGELSYSVCEWWFVAFSREIVYKPVRALTAEWGSGVTWPAFSTSDRERETNVLLQSLEFILDLLHRWWLIASCEEKPSWTCIAFQFVTSYTKPIHS